MLNTTQAAQAATVATVPAAQAATVPAATVAVPAAKPAASVASNKTAKPAAQAATAAKPAETADIGLATAVAVAATLPFYPGASGPFKPAAKIYSPFLTGKAPKNKTLRQAALLAAMLVNDTTGNIKPNGQFVRGGFRCSARLIDPKAKANAVVACQPETGCLSDMHNRTVKHVSGALSGKLARDAIFQIDLKLARAEISAFIGDKLGKLAIAKIDKLLKAA